jgi:flagellar FliL protein
MADQDVEAQAPATDEKGGGAARMAISAVGIFVVVLAAQIVAPPINRMIYGEPGAAGEEVVEDEDVPLAEAVVDLSELDPAIYTPLDPPLIVSLMDATGSSRFLQLSVQAMARDQGAIDEIRNHAPALRNSFLFLISNWTYEEISSLEGKEQLRAEMLNEARAIMQANTGEPAVEELYFTSLVIQ